MRYWHVAAGVAVILLSAAIFAGVFQLITERNEARSSLSATKQRLAEALSDLETRTLTNKATSADDLEIIFGDAKTFTRPAQLIVIAHTPAGDQETYLSEVAAFYSMTPKQEKAFIQSLLARKDVEVVSEKCYQADSPVTARVKWSAGYCTRTPVEKPAAITGTSSLTG
jgi:hypothetical protein